MAIIDQTYVLWYNLVEVVFVQMGNLTEAEKRMYDIIANYIREKQYSPSIRELCELAGYKSTSSIHNKIQRLIEKGYITMEPGCPRTLKIVKEIAT